MAHKHHFKLIGVYPKSYLFMCQEHGARNGLHSMHISKAWMKDRLLGVPLKQKRLRQYSPYADRREA